MKVKIQGLNENMVQIGKNKITAVNVQVEGFPQNIDGVDYGIYFEIPFPNGALWVVSRMKLNGKIEVEMFPNFNYNKEKFDLEFFSGWGDFMDSYFMFAR